MYAAIRDPNIEGRVLVFASSRVVAMKCSAAVAGVLEIGHGICKLKLKNLTFQSEVATDASTLWLISLFNSVLWFFACLLIM